MDEMRKAIEELRIAENLFNNAITEKEVDYATHRLNAAQVRIEMVGESVVHGLS